MKLTASQDRDAIGGWIEGQEGKRILGDLPRLQRGEGYLWAPGYGILDRVGSPAIRTFDSSRTRMRGERLATPRTLAEVDLTAILDTLAVVEVKDPGTLKSLPPTRSGEDRRRRAQLEQELAAAQARVGTLERENRELNSRLERIAALAACAARGAGPLSAAMPVAAAGTRRAPGASSRRPVSARPA